MIQDLSVLGFLELSLGRPAEAEGYLSRAVELEQTMGVREPAYFRVVPDEVEALVALGRLDEAEALLAPFEEAGRTSIGPGPSPRGPGAERSCWRRGAISRVRRPRPMRRCGYTIACLSRSSGGGRSWCAERWSAVRRGSGGSGHADEGLGGLRRVGATLWADNARAELARIGGRAPSSLDLTPTEDRVAALVAAGSTNREVADALFVSIHTVEANLKRIHRKLGIRSRTELASKFPPDASDS